MKRIKFLSLLVAMVCLCSVTSTMAAVSLPYSSGEGGAEEPQEETYEVVSLPYTSDYSDFSQRWKSEIGKLNPNTTKWAEGSIWPGPTPVARINYNPKGSGSLDAYLFSPHFAFEQGKRYIINFRYKTANADCNEKMAVYVGKTYETDEYVLANALKNYNPMNNTTLTDSGDLLFTPEEDGDYMVVFYAYSDEYMEGIRLTDFSVKVDESYSGGEDPGPGSDPDNTIPYSTKYTSSKFLKDWSIYSESESSNLWKIGNDGLSIVCNDMHAPTYDYWAVSPAFHFEPGDYTVSIELDALDSHPSAQEIIDLTLSEGLPTKSTVAPFKSYVIKGDDIFAVENDGNLVYKRIIEAKFSVDTEGDYRVGILDRSESSDNFMQWYQFNIKKIAIHEWTPQVAEWTQFDVDPETGVITANGNYMVLDNGAEASVEVGGVTYPLSVECKGFQVEFTGCPELNGDYLSLTLNIPEGAFVTDEGTAYPKVEEVIDIEYTVKDDMVSGITVADDQQSFSINMKETYAAFELTKNFNLTIKNIGGTVVEDMSDAEYTLATSGLKTTMTYQMPKLADNTYVISLEPKSLRTRLYTSSPWAFNAAVTSSQFEVSTIFTENGIRYQPLEAENEVAVIAPASGGKYSGNVVIPEKVVNKGVTYTVTKVADQAFYYASSVTSVTFPSTIKEIGNQAFAYCSGLSEIKLPDNITKIGNYAFYFCYNTTNIEMPRNVEEIGANAFYYLYLVSEFHLPNSLKRVDSNAFYYCKDGANFYIDIPADRWDEIFNASAFGYTNSRVNLYVPAGSESSLEGKGFKSVRGANIISGSEESEVLVDGYKYVCFPENGCDDMAVTYTRDFTGFANTWQALYVPFAVDASAVNGRVAELSRVYTENGARYVEWKVVDGMLQPGVPYLYKPAEDGVHAFSGNGVVHHSNVGTASKECDDFGITLTGVYEEQPVTVGDNNYYLNSDGNFHPAGVDSQLKPFRCFLTIDNPVQDASAPLYNVLNNGTDTPTAIGEIPFEVLESGKYYDLQGREVKNPTPGVYIVNGRKVVIK